MSEWKEYSGSDEQIAEIENALSGFIYRNAQGVEFANESDVSGLAHMSEYLICNPHPLADMICQQARTGQPVWIRTIHDEFLYGYKYFNYPPTITPDWNIPNAEYSFTEYGYLI